MHEQRSPLASLASSPSDAGTTLTTRLDSKGQAVHHDVQLDRSLKDLATGVQPERLPAGPVVIVVKAANTRAHAEKAEGGRVLVAWLTDDLA